MTPEQLMKVHHNWPKTAFAVINRVTGECLSIRIDDGKFDNKPVIWESRGFLVVFVEVTPKEQIS